MVDTYETDPSNTAIDSDGSHVPMTRSQRTQARTKQRRAEQTIDIVVNDTIDEVVAHVQSPAVVNRSLEASTGAIFASTIQTLLNQLEGKTTELLSLRDEVRKLRFEVIDKIIVIDQQRYDMEELRLALQASTMTTEDWNPRQEEEGLVHVSTQDDSLLFDEAPTNANKDMVNKEEGAAGDGRGWRQRAR